MLSLREGGIAWEREDARMMSKILGSEFAVVARTQDYRVAPRVMSILKLAAKNGLPMSPKAERALDRWEDHVAYVRKLRKREDAKQLDDPMSVRYFKHQRADIDLLHELKPTGVLNASEAGTGKTAVAINFADYIGAKRRMAIVPNSAKEQWADEIVRWSRKRPVIRILDGSAKHQIHQIKTLKKGWVVGHWESLVHAREGWLDDEWDFAMVDEIQFMQNRRAQRTETLYKIKADYRMALGAHPYANGVHELFPVLRFLYPELYTSFWRWAHMHIDIEEGVFGGLDLRTPKRPKLLKWEIAPFTIRRRWKDVFKNLPPITRVQCTAHLTKKGDREYKRLRTKFFAEMEAHRGEKKILAIPSVLARITRMRQYLVDPAILGASEKSVKYPIVYELIKELEGRPPAIFTMWRQSAVRLKKFLEQKGLKIGIVVGGMGRKINRVKKKFLRGVYDAVIIMIKVGGTSLNFGKYGTIIYLDHPWNQRDVEQTEGRVRRPEEGTGKLVPCTSYHIIVADSYEERMLVTRTDKHKDFAKVFPVAKALKREWREAA